MKKEIALLELLLVSLHGCGVFDHRRQQGAVAECEGAVLTYSEIDALTADLSPEDSAIVADRFIRQWATNLLLWEKAKGMEDKKIERLVEDYRRSLYVHAYEEHLVEQNMPKTIIDSTITQLYDRISGQLLLDESIFKGLLVVYPNDAPKTQRLKQWARQIIDSDISTEDMDQIEKYAYQHANGYELFTDRWLTTSDILKFIPIEHATLEKHIRQQNQKICLNALRHHCCQRIVVADA